LAAVLLLLPLSAFVQLPGEIRAKQALGLVAADCDVFDAGKGGWRREAPIPTLRDGPSSATWKINHVHLAAADGVLFVLGGMLEGLRDGQATGESWKFDPAVGWWEAIEPLPTVRGEGGVAVVDGRIHVLGGRSGRATLDTVESYDPGTDRWRRHEPMPTRRNHLGVTVHDGRVYALAGRQEDDVSLRVLERYDPGADGWTSLPDMPDIKAGFAFVTTPSGLVALGGENLAKFDLYGSILRYVPERRTWERLRGLAHPRHGFGAAYA